jgi:macrolide transport system ATP-binding/permease protein
MMSDKVACSIYSPPLISLIGVSKTYGHGAGAVPALQNISLTIHAGEMLAIEGASGSGKSTLMHILGGLDQHFEGEFFLAGHSVRDLPEAALARLRLDTIGFVFQRYHLIDYLRAIENVMLPMLFAGAAKEDAQLRAMALLTDMNMQAHAQSWPKQLSGGQQQRVAIARALANRAPLILADEPTGALDSDNSDLLMDLLCELNQNGHTVVVITHSDSVAARASRRLKLRDGRVVSSPSDRCTSNTTDQHLDRAAAADFAPYALATSRLSPSFNRLRWSLSQKLQSACLSIKRNLLRSLLSTLGIVVGIASVISTLAVADAAEQEFLKQLTQMSRVIEVRSVEQAHPSGLGSTNANGFSGWERQALLDTKMFEKVMAADSSIRQVSFKSKTYSSEIRAVEPGFFSTSRLPVLWGSVASVDLDRPVAEAVINSNLAEKLALNERTQDLWITIDMQVLKVGAVVKTPGDTSPRVWVSHSYAKERLFSPLRLNLWLLGIEPAQDLITVIQRTQAWFAKTHVPQSYTINSTLDYLLSVAEANRLIHHALIAIALICLVVGGIGVTNVIFMSVRERFQEIGIRMAIGSPRSDVLTHFLLESVLLCSIGGVLGVLLSIFLAQVFTWLGVSWHYNISFLIALGAFGFSLLVGMTAGYAPALSASKKNVIDMLSDAT